MNGPPRCIMISFGPRNLGTWCNGNISSHCKVDARTWMGVQFFRLFHQWTQIHCWHNGDAHYDALSHEHSTIIAQFVVVLHPSKEFSCSDGKSCVSSCLQFMTQSACCMQTFPQCSSTNMDKTAWRVRCRTPRFQGYMHHYQLWCIAGGIVQHKHIRCLLQNGN